MELALAVTEKRVDRPGSVFYRPVGAIMLGRSVEQIRRKWAEIICVLSSPVRRQSRGARYCDEFASFPHTGVLSVLWRPEWFEAYWLHERRPKDMPLDDLWHLITADGRVLDALPKEPLGTCHITEAWPWSDAERKELCLCAMDEAAMTPTERETVAARGEYAVGRETCFGPLNRIDFQTDVGLSTGDLAKVLDPTVLVHPRLDVTLPKTLIKTTSGPVMGGAL